MKHVEIAANFDAPEGWTSGVFTPDGGICTIMQAFVAQHAGVAMSDVGMSVRYDTAPTDLWGRGEYTFEEAPLTTQGETPMSNYPINTMPLQHAAETISAVFDVVQSSLDYEPNDVNLQTSAAALNKVLGNLDLARQGVERWAQLRSDRAAVLAIKTAIHETFASDGNVEGARGMLADIECFGNGIMQAIRDAGYVISPEPPF